MILNSEESPCTIAFVNDIHRIVLKPHNHLLRVCDATPVHIVALKCTEYNPPIGLQWLILFSVVMLSLIFSCLGFCRSKHCSVDGTLILERFYNHFDVCLCLA